LRDKDGDFFEADKISNFVNNNASKSAKEFNDCLLTEINNFKGEQEYSDDIAIITCKIYN